MLLHRMRPRLYLGSDWARKITATPPPHSAFPPLLPEGFCVHILLVDYQRCQSRALHSSCCPHCGSGANLSRQHWGGGGGGGGGTFSHGPGEAGPLYSTAPLSIQPVGVCRKRQQARCSPEPGQAAHTLCLSLRFLPCGAFKQ